MPKLRITKAQRIALLTLMLALHGCGGGSGGGSTTPPAGNGNTAADTTSPSIPTGLSLTQSTVNSLSVQWVASTDNVAVTRYEVLLDGTLIGGATTTSFTFTGLSPASAYSITIKAADAAGNLSSASVALNASTAAANAGGFAISSAIQNASVITVTGIGFGAKAIAAPIKYEDFENRSNAALPTSFGYTNYGGFGGTTAVDGTTAYSGTKSLLHQAHFGVVSDASNVEESFPHIAVTGFSASELYLSYHLKFKTNGSRIVQLKFNRSGMEVAGANGSPCYGGKPKFFSSYYPTGPSADRYSADKSLTGLEGGVVRDDGSITEGWVGETFLGTSVLTIQEDTWVQVEEYYRLNDIGMANGEHVTYVNGNLQFNRHDISARSSTAQVFNCSYLVVGMDYWINPGATNGVSVWYDDHYLDNTRARLVLANAASWSAATVRNPQPASQWNDASIVADLKRSGFAAGDAWLYVVRSDGSASPAWKIILN